MSSSAMETDSTSSELSSSDIAQQTRRHVSDSDDELPQIYLSVIWQGGKLGVAYYDVDAATIHMMLDTPEKNDFLLLKTVKHQIQPSCVITSSKQDDKFITVLQTLAQDSYDNENSEENLRFSNGFIQLLPSLEFNQDVCKRRLLAIDLPSIPEHYTETERTIHVSSLVPFDNVNMVRATGALLKFLEKNRIGVELEDAEVRVPIIALKVFSLGDLMIVDENTFSALQIFNRETHPSVYKSGSCGNSGAKEGLSLYGVMNRCRSAIGSRLLRLWFMRPLKNSQILKQRHSAITFFLNPRNAEVIASMQSCLKNIKNIPGILSRMRQAKASMGDWQALYKTAFNAVYIADLARGHSRDVYIFKIICDTFTEELNQIASLINKIVDFEESAAQNRFIVKPNIDPELDERKRTYNGLPDFMTKVARAELDCLDDINECNVIYLPQLGYLLAIPFDNITDVETSSIPGLSFIFSSNKMHHFKSEATKELDILLGDTQCEITDHETNIMHRVQDLILQLSPVLINVMDYAAELDCLLSLADCAKELNYVCPQFTDSTGVKVIGGRHPLQELCCSPFVANDWNSGADASKVKILTGPNASGKSIYLKQVATIVYMAHIGSFVPAESAVIGPIDRIFTRIRTSESVSVGLSTYMIDLTQVSSSLQSATGNSLVILDEFGKGTEMVDGIALLAACIRHWIAKRENCPHLLVSTHFHGIIHQHLLPDSQLVSYQTMETIQEGNELVFLYGLIDGYAACSYAGHVAAQAGLPDEIILRGREVSKMLRENKPINRVANETYENQYKRCSTIVEKFLELDLEKDDIHKFLREVVLPTSKDLL
ncbi:mutS protein homolog 5-like [Tubulanus polymorphus]|uniref:mutS protein homolog 5-like n=1 Tax=Tubulanus polymorphus TaxID=672921 RepID=UPI003DA4B253